MDKEQKEIRKTYDQNKNINKEIKITKNKQILKLKNTIIALKNSLKSFNS